MADRNNLVNHKQPSTYQTINEEIDKLWKDNTLISGLYYIVELVKLSYNLGNINENEAHELVSKAVGLTGQWKEI